MNKRAMRSGLMLCFSRWNRKGYAIFASLGRNVRIGRLAIHICEMSLQKSSRKGVIVMLAEVFERLERLFEGYVEKVKRAGCELLPTRMGMEDVFINSYHNLKFEGIPVLGQGYLFYFLTGNRK